MMTSPSEGPHPLTPGRPCGALTPLERTDQVMPPKKNTEEQFLDDVEAAAKDRKVLSAIRALRRVLPRHRAVADQIALLSSLREKHEDLKVRAREVNAEIKASITTLLEMERALSSGQMDLLEIASEEAAREAALAALTTTGRSLVESPINSTAFKGSLASAEAEELRNALDVIQQFHADQPKRSDAVRRKYEALTGESIKSEADLSEDFEAMTDVQRALLTEPVSGKGFRAAARKAGLEDVNAALGFVDHALSIGLEVFKGVQLPNRVDRLERVRGRLEA